MRPLSILPTLLFCHVVAAQTVPSPVVTTEIGTGCNGAKLHVVDAPQPGWHHLRVVGEGGFFAPIGITVVVLGVAPAQLAPIPLWAGCEILDTIDCSFVLQSDVRGQTVFSLGIPGSYTGVLNVQMLPFDSFGQLRATPIVEITF